MIIELHTIECCNCKLVYTDIANGRKEMPQPCPKCKSTKANLLKNERVECIQ